MLYREINNLGLYKMETRELTQPFQTNHPELLQFVLPHTPTSINVSVFTSSHTHFGYFSVKTTWLLREISGRQATSTGSSERVRKTAWVLLTFAPASTDHLVQASATYGTRTKRGTRNDFQRHAE
jgi:hypothetical protein